MKIKTIILLAALAVATPKILQTEYTMSAYVSMVIQPNELNPDGLVLCKSMNNQRLFAFEGSEDWLEGDTLDITLNDNGTPETYEDDEIIKTTYTGWIY